jgi:RimJ/RimL family protein N-acetyltransferase
MWSCSAIIVEQTASATKMSLDTNPILSVPLETERLVLDQWQSADWTDFRPIATDSEVMRYITGGVPWTDEQIRGFVDRQVKLYSERRFCRWKLLRKPERELIGFCGVGFWRDAPEPEIGWWLERKSWGQGLATEAARVLFNTHSNMPVWIKSFPSRGRKTPHLYGS